MKRTRNKYKAKTVYKCPQCGNQKRIDIVRIKCGVNECRACRKVFTRHDVMDGFEFK